MIAFLSAHIIAILIIAFCVVVSMLAVVIAMLVSTLNFVGKSFEILGRGLLNR